MSKKLIPFGHKEEKKSTNQKKTFDCFNTCIHNAEKTTNMKFSYSQKCILKLCINFLRNM